MNNYQEIPAVASEVKTSTTFLEDVIAGLSAEKKHLDSKYFYDRAGDKLFQEIMHCPEYYPTDCELEILSSCTKEITDKVLAQQQSFDLVELGAGDALKSVYLLKYFSEQGVDFTYYPIDISENVISLLHKSIPEQIPSISIHGLNGEYFEMLKAANNLSKRAKLVLFLGSNIGNMIEADARAFVRSLRELLSPGDLLLIGIDLKKNPKKILDAYNDRQGFTRDFNLNLLHRINRELDADFNISQFEHYPCYDPRTGACHSYLVSLKDQRVTIGPGKIAVDFKENECIHMEISQKYSLDQVDELAESSGFTPLAHFFDSNKWFVDALWKC